MNNLGKKTWFLDIFSGMSVYARSHHEPRSSGRQSAPFSKAMLEPRWVGVATVQGFVADHLRLQVSFVIPLIACAPVAFYG
jgi:hypothetical protein